MKNADKTSSSTSKIIDEYIAKSADFAKPILTHLRALVHKACPETEETIKWSMPTFIYNGKILCMMASFTNHCSFGFWKSSRLRDVAGILENEGSAGSLGKLMSKKDLPADKLIIAYIKETATLNEIDVPKTTQPKKKPKPELPMPPELTAALKKNKKAKAVFDAFSPSHRREYIEWIIEAKTEDTRDRRIGKTIEQLKEGKSRHWKYQK